MSDDIGAESSSGNHYDNHGGGQSESGHGWHETKDSYFFPEDRPPVEKRDSDEDDEEEDQPGEEVETVVVENADNADDSAPEEELAPAEVYDGSKCYHPKDAADQQIGKRVAHRFDNGVIYMGEVVDTKFKPATSEDPAHFTSIVKYGADRKTDEVWKSRLLKDNKLHFHVSMTYGRFALDSLAAPPV